MKTWIISASRRVQPFCMAGGIISGRRELFGASQPLEGKTRMPPSRPLSARRAISTSPLAFSNQYTVPLRSGLGFFAARFGKTSAVPLARPAQISRHGHKRQSGRLGVHRVAPRSIMACAKSPGRSCGTSPAFFSLTSAFSAGSGVCISNSRASTRSILPSTGAAGRLKAMAAMAAAV